jgi:hypothetical protein
MVRGWSVIAAHRNPVSSRAIAMLMTVGRLPFSVTEAGEVSDLGDQPERCQSRDATKPREGLGLACQHSEAAIYSSWASSASSWRSMRSKWVNICSSAS